MNKYVKSFLHRGVIFGGFGPIVVAVVHLILSFCIEDFSLGGVEMFTAVISAYVLAFVHAGASIFTQIESWPIAKSLLYHFGALYIAYTACYLINRWIAFDIKVLLIFTLIFLSVYFAVWLTVFILVRRVSKKLYKKLG